MKRGALNVAAAAALVGWGAPSAKAATPVVGPASNTVELRVVNNHAAPVQVYVRDARGKLHRLGRVQHSGFKVLQIPGDLTATGDVQIRIYPDLPPWSPLATDDGVRTRSLELELDDSVSLFVETDLADSRFQVERG